jgi:hypothetical protein
MMYAHLKSKTGVKHRKSSKGEESSACYHAAGPGEASEDSEDGSPSLASSLSISFEEDASSSAGNSSGSTAHVDFHELQPTSHGQCGLHKKT